MIAFKLTQAETLKVRDWDESHPCSLRNEALEAQGAPQGGHLTFKFTPTGIGIVAKVECSCGEELDLTDYTTW